MRARPVALEDSQTVDVVTQMFLVEHRAAELTVAQMSQEGTTAVSQVDEPTVREWHALEPFQAPARCLVSVIRRITRHSLPPSVMSSRATLQ